MKENLNYQNKEEIVGEYDQFNTEETFHQNKKNKKLNIFSPKKLIKYILITFVVLCLMLLILLNLTKYNINSTNSEFNSKPKKLKLPLEKNELTIKNEVHLIENKITLNNSIKGTDINIGDQEIILMNVFITVNKKCLTDNCIDCYLNDEIKKNNYYKLSDKEAIHKEFDEMGLSNTFIKGVYFNSEMTRRNKNWVYSVWNKYKRKMIHFEGIPYIDNFNAKIYPEKYNNEYIQAIIKGYEFTIIDHIYEKNNTNYIYNNISIKFDEIKLNIKCQRKGDDINYPELSDKEACDKVFREMGLSYFSFEQKNIYKDPSNEKVYRDWKRDASGCHPGSAPSVYYVWNNYKRKMMRIDGTYEMNIYDNEYLSAAALGYKFTLYDHIYEKDKKFFRYVEKVFYEIKIDSI